MPQLARIRLFPIKALDPVEVAQAEVLPQGALAWDRRLALVDSQGRFVNGKRTAAVHRIRCRYDLQNRTVWLQAESCTSWQAFPLAAGVPELEEFFSDALGQKVQVVENSQGGFPDDQRSPGPTLVSTASLRQVARWFQLEVEQVRCRFRANLEVEDTPPWWEDQLVSNSGQGFSVGQVVWRATGVCQRCVVPSRHPHTGQVLEGFARRFAQLRQESLPAWSPRERFDHFYRLAVNTQLVSSPGIIRVGEAVRFPVCE